MSKYGQYCPTARAVEILGDRWTLLIVRDLLGGAVHFNALERGLPGIPRAVLTDRLKRLQRYGVIERHAEENRRKTIYRLTEAGVELLPLIQFLTQWGARWAFGEPEESELNPPLLLWWIHDRIYMERLPNHQVVVEFDFYETRPNRYWLVLRPDDVSVCMTPPGFDTDLMVTAELNTFFQVWVGRVPFADALREERIVLDGTPNLIHNFPSWLALSRAAPAVQSELAAKVV